MRIILEKPRRVCPYCGQNPRRTNRGEHVLQQALGGALAIEFVCGKCNGGFSSIDQELCSRSPLALVASQVIGNRFTRVWDVDQSSKNLLHDADPCWPSQSLAAHPQIVFERGGPTLTGSVQDMRAVGPDAFADILVASARRAFRYFEGGEKGWINLERIPEEEGIHEFYRLPPRLFFPHSIRHLAEALKTDKGARAILRFQKPDERRHALNTLDTWRSGGHWRNVEFRMGASESVVRIAWDAGMVLRAMFKNAVNLLLRFCTRTAFDHDNLGRVIRVIEGRFPIGGLIQRNGFVDARDIQCIADPSGAHTFRILHERDSWAVYSSYFGGRAGSFVSFPGPSSEEWRVAEVRAPIKSSDWTLTPLRILPLPIPHSIVLNDASRIVPSVGLYNVRGSMRVVRTNRGRRADSIAARPAMN